MGKALASAMEQKAAMEAAGKTKKTSRRKKNFSSWGLYIGRVKAQVAPNNKLTGTARRQLSALMTDTFQRLANEAQTVLRVQKKATLTSREIQTAVRLLLPIKLAKHAVSEGVKAVTKFSASSGGVRQARSSKTTRAGLQVSVGRVHSMLKAGNFAARVSAGAAVYLAAAIEYLLAEILELSYEVAEQTHWRITSRDVMIAVRNDTELSKLFSTVTFANAGVIPHIQPALEKKKPSKAKKSTRKSKTAGGVTSNTWSDI